MEITPALGLGDIIQLKMYSIFHNIQVKKINININLLKKYKGDGYQKSLLFTKKLLKSFFKDTEIEENEKLDMHFVEKIKFDHTIINLKEEYQYQNNIEFTLEEEYIIFHTKLRLDNVPLEQINNIIDIIDLFSQTFKTDKTILIMGERKIIKNYETELHHVKSLYTNLMKLSIQNKVIDLTSEELINGNDYYDFEKDLKIIEKASHNVIFGIGGPFSLSLAFSNNNLLFVPIHFYKNTDYYQVLEQIFKSKLIIFDSILLLMNYLLKNNL